MKKVGLLGAQFAVKFAFPIATAVALVVCFAAPSFADRKSQAREQFARAVRMRTTLEGYLEKDRALDDYKQTVAAYHKVYLISVTADEVTPSLIAEAELYEEMGRLYDSKYFKSSIDAYNFLIKQYPGSRYRGSAMLAIARIQKQDRADADAAEATYKDYLKLFPHSENGREARDGLKEIAAQRAQVPAASADQAQVAVADRAENQPPTENGPHVQPRADDQKAAAVKEIRTWNSQDSTRIVLTLDDTIRFEAARIASPDRIYFDISKARLAPNVSRQPLDVQGGLLKSVRIAPNKPGVVRLVLDVDGAKDYSAYLLANPYRFVIDVHAQRVNTAKDGSAPAPVAAAVPAVTNTADAAHTVAAHETVAVSIPAPTAPAPTASLDTAVPAVAEPLANAVPKTPSSLKRDSAAANKIAGLAAPAEPKPMRDGDHSLTRALGLKINRIVIDPGHGGHDTGTIGPHGLMEKDLCLDVALRLGALIRKKLPGAEVIYTRQDDTFVPLEDRTKIANESKADLFISIHANSSPNPAARGVETYYLNFATSPESMEVAARENANSQESLHDLQDIIQKIARNEKIEESKELAADIQGALTQRLQLVSTNERNRGVKKAPFIVLIGAHMPSVLTEISFVSNPYDERLLRKPDQRQRIADGLYRGIVAYLSSLNSLSNNRQKLISDNHPSDTRLDVGAVASTGNPK
jgi:N-acetylmuramoyl-L-alanine amidase